MMITCTHLFAGTAVPSGLLRGQVIHMEVKFGEDWSWDNLWQCSDHTSVREVPPVSPTTAERGTMTLDKCMGQGPPAPAAWGNGGREMCKIRSILPHVMRSSGPKCQVDLPFGGGWSTPEFVCFRMVIWCGREGSSHGRRVGGRFSGYSPGVPEKKWTQNDPPK